MLMCMKCKQGTTQARGIQLRKSDTTMKGVCMKCYESLTAYRAKRKAKEEATQMKRDNIRVDGHRGTWYVIDEVTHNGETYFLLEHETYGEDADHICIDENEFNIFSHITGGITEIVERLEELEEEK